MSITARMRLAALLLLGSLALAQGQDVVVVDEEVLPEEPLCPCTDVTPRVKYDGPPSDYECFVQKQAGSCDQPFMMQTIEELQPEGYCQITCGRCDCCSSVKQILEKEGLTEFLWAAEYAGGNLWSFFQEPGWQVTVLAPENEVMKQGLSNWGIDRSSASKHAAALTAIVQTHIIPRKADIKAVYTTPFLTTGVKLQPMLEEQYSGGKLEFSHDGKTTHKVSLKGSTATLIKKDIEACMSMVNVIGSFLSPSSVPPEDTAQTGK